MTSQGEKGRPINWGHPAVPPHLPPKSPAVGSACHIGPPSVKTRVPNQSARIDRHRRTPSASFIPDVEPAWLDELLDSPKASQRKSSHRRSASDTMAFLDVKDNFRKADDIAEEEEFDRVSVASMLSKESTDHIEEQQLVSLFSDMDPFHDSNQLSEISRRATYNTAVLCSGFDAWSLGHRSHITNPQAVYNAPDTSYGNDGPYDKSKTWQEFDSTYYGEDSGIECGAGEKMPLSGQIDPNLDPKRGKRIASNRHSAQRSRVRKLQYISELEGTVNALQTEVNALSTQVALLEHQRASLHVDNTLMKQRMAVLAKEKRFKDVYFEALKKELQNLKYLQQQQERLQQLLTTSVSSSDPLRRHGYGPSDVRSSANLHTFTKFANQPNNDANLRGTGTTLPHSSRSAMSSGLPSSCMLTANDNNLDKGMMTGSGQLPQDFMLQNL